MCRVLFSNIWDRKKREMFIILEFLSRVLIACGLFVVCLFFLWFVAWMLILRHIKLFKEIVYGSGKTPHPSHLPSLHPSQLKISPRISSFHHSGRSHSRSPSPLSLPPPMSTINYEELKSKSYVLSLNKIYHLDLKRSPLDLKRSPLDPPKILNMTPVSSSVPFLKLTLSSAKVKPPIKENPRTTPCHVNYFVDNWF